MSDEAVADQAVEGETRTPETEVQARELGWVPKEEFRGDPEKWVDAQAYLDHGNQVLPIVRATNKRLKDEIEVARRENEALRGTVRETNESVRALQEYHAEELKQTRERVRAELLEKLKGARKENDVDEEIKITGELSKMDAQDAVAQAAPPPAKKTNGEAEQPPKIPPEVEEWGKRNPWYGTDLARTSIAQGVAMQLRRSEPSLKGIDFLERVVEGTNKELARLGVTVAQRSDTKVEAGRGGAGGSTGGAGGGGKSYADLPADAKAECDRWASDPRLVGPTRIHKDAASFRKQWAGKYFEDN